jgi:methionine sulfoxide reductase heme-binding subunit
MMTWEITRASAFVAFGCYTLVVTWGVLLSSRFWKPAAPQLGFHRFLGTLGLAAVATHITTLMLDHYAKVYWSSLVGLDPRPGVVVGSVALWLIIALPLSFRLKQRRLMTQKAWRGLHYAGYLMWAAALVHGIASGTDTRSPWAIAVYGGAAAVVGAASWWRWMELPAPARRPARQAAVHRDAPERRPQPHVVREAPQRRPRPAMQESE